MEREGERERVGMKDDQMMAWAFAEKLSDLCCWLEILVFMLKVCKAVKKSDLKNSRISCLFIIL